MLMEYSKCIFDFIRNFRILNKQVTTNIHTSGFVSVYDINNN